MPRTLTAWISLALTLLPGTGPAQEMLALQSSGPEAALIYPGATIVGSGTTGELHQVGFTTEDSPDDVLSFYEEQLGESLAATCLHGGNEKLTASFNDVREVEGGALSVRVLTQVAQDHFATVTITRASGESLTHAVLLYVQK